MFSINASDLVPPSLEFFWCSSFYQLLTIEIHNHQENLLLDSTAIFQGNLPWFLNSLGFDLEML